MRTIDDGDRVALAKEARAEAAHNARRWKAEVIADPNGKWLGNGLTFATKREAEDYVWDLSMRWSAVRMGRVVPVEG